MYVHKHIPYLAFPFRFLSHILLRVIPAFNLSLAKRLASVYYYYTHHLGTSRNKVVLRTNSKKCFSDLTSLATIITASIQES